MSNSEPEVQLESMRVKPKEKKPKQFHFFCRGNHWEVNPLTIQLVLKTPTGEQKEQVRKLVRTLEAQVRVQAHHELMSIDLTQNRKQIVKFGLEKSLKAVQQLMADALLAKYQSSQGSKDETKSDSNGASSININLDGSSITSESTSTNPNQESGTP